MSNFAMNIKDPSGVSRFLQPRVIVAGKDKAGKDVEKLVNNISGTYARDLAYIAMAIGENESAFMDKTKRDAGKLSLEGLKGTPAGATFRFQLPIKYDDRDAISDGKKFVTVLEVSQPDMVKTATALAKVAESMDAIEATVKTIVAESASSAKQVNPMPVYFTGEGATRAKSAGGSKAHGAVTFD